MNVSQFTSISPEQLRTAATRLRNTDGRLQMAYAWYPEPHRLELRYVATEAGQHHFAIWRCAPTGPVPSLAGIWPLISWYEREITDLFGVEFSEHPQPSRLVLHDEVNPVRPPLDPDYPRETLLEAEPTRQSIPEVAGAEADVQLLPFGPVRADVVESGEFLFFYIGEAILHYQPRLFFKHRGMEKRFEGLSSDQGIVLAERVSGVGSVAHALGLLPSDRSGGELCRADTRALPAGVACGNGAHLQSPPLFR